MTYRNRLPQLSTFTFGTAEIRDPANPEHLKVARAAMDAGVWFHSAREYGNVYEVLKIAFKEDPKHVPPCIIKIHGGDAEKMRDAVETTLRDTRLPCIAVGQVCGQPDPVKDLRPGCRLYDTMGALQEEGKVGAYVLELWRPETPTRMELVKQDLFDAYIFYYNVVDREVPNALFDLLEGRRSKILSLRTLGGGDAKYGYTGVRDEKLVAAMRTALEDLYQRSGCSSRIEFRMRFPMSVPNVITTIGATAKMNHLKAFLECHRNFRPLAPEIVAEVRRLHRIWFAE